MKHKFFVKAALFFCTLILLSSCASSQGTVQKEKVVDALQRFDQAMIEGNSEVLDSITSKDLSYGHSSGIIQNKEQFLEDALNGPFRFLSINNEEQKITLSGDVAVVRHILTGEGTNAGNPTTVKIGIVMVFQKNNENEIVLLARQAYPL